MRTWELDVGGEVLEFGGVGGAEPVVLVGRHVHQGVAVLARGGVAHVLEELESAA